MSAFLFASRYFAEDGPQRVSIDNTLFKHARGRARLRGPIVLSEAMVYIPHDGALRYPVQLHFKAASDAGLELLWALSDLVKVDYNRETYDNGVLLQFGSVQDAVLYRLNW